MDEEEFESKQENENNTLRDIFDEFIEEEAGYNVPKREFSEEFKKLSDKVLRYIDRMLGFRKNVIFDNGYPYNRRFHREEFWQFAKNEFTDDEQERGENYDEVLDYLVDEQYLLFIERASDPMFDVFQAVLV